MASGRGESATSPRRLTANERQAKALALRKSGLTYEAIAEQLGYSSREGARKAIETALRNTIQEPADELRRLECERLDAMLAALWWRVEAGHPQAVDAALRVMARRAALLGLDAPKRVDVRYLIEQEARRVAESRGLPLDEVMSELEQILAEAAVNGRTG